MNTPAIHQAIRLEKHPEELAWLCYPDSDFPEGISDLLRLCSSKEQLAEFANNNDLEVENLSSSLFNFIEKAIVNEKNCDEKILGTDKLSSLQLQKYHYQLLMKIYHPDNNNDPQATHYSSLISSAYQRLKDNNKEQEEIRFSEYRKTPKSYYAASQQAESQISHLKTAIAVISAVTIFSLVAMTGKLYDPANPDLITANTTIDTEQTTVEEPQSLLKISAVQSEAVQPNIPTIKASSTQLQSLLKQLEVAYEKGDVKSIAPILANSPEIKNQTNKQLFEKLETLFEITEERKMVLFDFKWANTEGKLKGQGKFLSRYLLVGEKKWLTREGNASANAEIINNKLNITQLILENQNID